MSNTTDTSVSDSDTGYLSTVLFYAFAILAVLGFCTITGALLYAHELTKAEDPAYLFKIAARIKNNKHPRETPPDLPVLVTGRPKFQLGESEKLIRAKGPVLAFERKVESYSWVETPLPKEKLPPPPHTPRDLYEYHAEWTENPVPWRKLKVWTGHITSAPPQSNEKLEPESFSVGRLILNPGAYTLMGWEDYVFTDDQKYPDGAVHDKNLLYPYASEINDPKPGDWRISYKVVPLDKKKPTVTVLGTRDFNRLIPFKAKTGKQFLLVYPGTPDEMEKVLGPRKPLDISLSPWIFPLLILGLILAAGGIGLAILIGKKRKNDRTVVA